MKKLILGVALIALLAGCQLFNPPLAPPTWIQGVWKDHGSGTMTFTFTSDDVIMTSPGMSIDYKLFDDAVGTVSDSSSGSIYSVFIKADGNITETLKFEKLTSSTMNYSITAAGMTIGPLLFDKK